MAQNETRTSVVPSFTQIEISFPTTLKGVPDVVSLNRLIIPTVLSNCKTFSLLSLSSRSPLSFHSRCTGHGLSLIGSHR